MTLPNFSKYDEIAYDTETTGLNPHDGDRVFCYSIATPDADYAYDYRDHIFYQILNMGQNDEKLTAIAKGFNGISFINNEFEKFKGTIICHNLSFDYRISKATGIHFNLNQAVDTCILACLINEHELAYSLDYLTGKYTNSRKQGEKLYEDMAKIFGGRATKNVQMKRISEAPPEIVVPYACSDTRGTYELYQYQKAQIAKQGLEKIVEFERKLTPVLIDAEMRGVRVDNREAERAVHKLTLEIDQSQKALNKKVGFAVNVNANAHIKSIFKPEWRDGEWWAKDGTKLQTTDSGAASLKAEVLRTISDPLAADILELRSLMKTRDTFLVGHVLESSINGRVYPTINQAKGDGGGTGTGRLSYAGPALQQIPDRNKEVAKTVKRVFLPEEGQVWVDADMASFEVRVFAHLVGTKDICQAYYDDPETDFHAFVADLTNLPRNATYNGEPNAKQLNLAMIFNQGKGSTAEAMGMPWEWSSFLPKDSKDGKVVTFQKAGPEAEAVIEKYHNRLPGVKKLADGCSKTAKSRGYIFTRYGRHLRFPRGYKAYKASGILIQGTAADENKQNWLEITEALSGTGGSLLLNTHDSYSMSLPEDRAKEIATKVKRAVEKDRGLRVPLILEVQNPGKNWWESKSSNRWM
jgi:DNA polymerase I-like protein with 3'-5' exonuclease and polymerase domains